jgi:hypothetical protein
MISWMRSRYWYSSWRGSGEKETPGSEASAGRRAKTSKRYPWPAWSWALETLTALEGALGLKLRNEGVALVLALDSGQEDLLAQRGGESAESLGVRGASDYGPRDADDCDCEKSMMNVERRQANEVYGRHAAKHATLTRLGVRGELST